MNNAVIGRFQPLTVAHQQLIETAIADGPTTVVIGSMNERRSFRNPWTYEERYAMIRAVFPDVRIVGLEDSHYDFYDWCFRLEALVGKDATVYGHCRDESSYYLKALAWDFHEVGILRDDISATAVRQLIFNSDCSFDDIVRLSEALPAPVLEFVSKWSDHDKPIDFHREFVAVRKYQDAWKGAPYQPVFVAADALVTCRGKILLVTRGKWPGYGSLAMPGGHLEPSESLAQCSERELKEETGIDLALYDAKRTAPVVFDAPWRDVRGRYITHVFRYDLDIDPPEVNGLDDACHADWYDLSELKSDDFFADHYHILRRLI